MKRLHCIRCQRPKSHCLCPWLPLTPQPSSTRVVVLQHPSETKHPLNTARFLPIGLANCDLLIGENFPQITPMLANPNYQSALLFPHSQALAPTEIINPQKPWQIFIPDGTWRKAKLLLHLNPQLTALPHISVPPAESAYIFRRSPVPNSHSTLEATTAVLATLEPELDGSLLLAPLHRLMADQREAMGDTIFQQHYR